MNVITVDNLQSTLFFILSDLLERAVHRKVDRIVLPWGEWKSCTTWLQGLVGNTNVVGFISFIAAISHLNPQHRYVHNSRIICGQRGTVVILDFNPRKSLPRYGAALGSEIARSAVSSESEEFYETLLPYKRVQAPVPAVDTLNTFLMIDEEHIYVRQVSIVYLIKDRR